MTSLLTRIRALLAGPADPPERRRPFEEILGLFRRVLEDGNRALQLITDMGETLGGDFLFDSMYVKRACEQLAEALADSIRDFTALTAQRYSELPEVIARLDSRIRDVIEDRRVPYPGFLLFLDEITWELGRDVGGKGAALGEMKNELHLGVPEGFVLTTFAFDRYVAHNDLAGPIGALGARGDKDALLAEIQGRFLSGAVPDDVVSALDRALVALRRRNAAITSLAVRSSAPDEDSDFSFAGQFETVLNVPLESGAVLGAWRRVMGSLFSPKAVAYQRRLGLDVRDQKMAACCLGMIDAATSGVLYTSDPRGGETSMIVNATWGLGAALVEGHVDADTFVVRKSEPPEIVDSRLGGKEFAVTALGVEGVHKVQNPSEKRQALSLTPEQVLNLTHQGLLLERHFHRPQDVEWAIDRASRIFLLQSRPLRLEENKSAPAGRPEDLAQPSGAPVLLRGRGTVVQKGIGAGRVYRLRAMEELDAFPRGAVLVARNDSSQFVKVLPYVAAVITDIGTPTSHMASLCREFRVPTVVDMGDATTALTHGAPVTVVVADEDVTIYDGVVPELSAGRDRGRRMDEVYEFRKKRYLLRFIVPLHLIDPLREEFTPQGCRSIHDVLRFIHEKSVMALMEHAQCGRTLPSAKRGVRLELPIPIDIVAIDIGGGLEPVAPGAKAGLDRITSAPLRALLQGMAQPGAWQTGAVPLEMGDFLTSMFRTPDIASRSAEYLCPNVAIASREYVNLSLRFGYHFTVLDCYDSERARFNHIYFRFFGGATDLSKRSRRVQLIAIVLGEYGFTIQTKGDLIIARLANVEKEQLETALDRLGRLLGFTRQLDAQLPDDVAVEQAARKFLKEGRGTSPP